jgi:hypothetical protein
MKLIGAPDTKTVVSQVAELVPCVHDIAHPQLVDCVPYHQEAWTLFRVNGVLIRRTGTNKHLLRAENG